MERMHLWFGVAVLLLFAGTGQWMLGFVPALPEDQQMTRMAWRAGHIYIMFSGVIHLLLGLNYTALQTPLAARLQFLAGGALVLTTLGLIYGFFTEPGMGQIDRPITALSAIATFVVATGLLVLSAGDKWLRTRQGD